MTTTDQIAAEPPVPRHTDLEQQARALITQRPVVSVLTAVGVGYLVARLVSRATR